MNASRLYLFCFFVWLISGCSTIPSSGVKTNPSGSMELTTDFRLGSAKLECELSCATAWGANRRQLRAVHDAGLWEDLALNVLRIGFSNDLAYYYLGRSAEGLGYHSAAEVYYRRSIAAAISRPKCNFLFNNCDGFVFPKDAESRLIAVLQTKQTNTKQYTPAVETKETPISGPTPVPVQDQRRDNCNRAYGEYFEKAQGTKDLDSAISLYRDGLALCPDDDVAHYELGNLLASRNRYAEAEAEFAAALKINPEFADAKKQLEVVRKNRR